MSAKETFPENKNNDTKPVETKAKKDKPKPQRQPGDPEGYTPGGYKAFNTPVMKLRETNPGTIVVDPTPVIEFVSVMTAAVYPNIQKELGEVAPPQEEVQGSNTQMMSYLLAKQFVSSAPHSKAWIGSQYGKHLSNRISVPNGLVALARQYGTIKSEDSVFEVAGHAVWASTFLMRGVGLGIEPFRGVDQLVNRQLSVAVDVNFPDAWQELCAWAAGVVNQYCRGKPLRMVSNDLAATVTDVKVETGFDLFWRAFQFTGFPAHVIRALRIGALAELAIDQDLQFNALDANHIQQFNAQGVAFLSWDRRTHDSRFATYLAAVQMPLLPVYEHTFKMVEVSSMGYNGELGQTLTRSGYETVVGTNKMGADQIDLGLMLAGEKSGVIPANFPLTIQNAPSAVDQKNAYVQGMLRAGKNKS